MSNNLKKLAVVSAAAVSTAAIVLVNSVLAVETIQDVGALVCVTDKWDEKEPEKGHKLVNYAGRCVFVPDDSAALKFSEACAGKYEYLPDQSWKGSGTCTRNYKDGGTVTDAYEEGSHLKEYVFKTTGGTGKFTGAGGGGTYVSETLTDTLLGGRLKGKLVLP